jgi:hypothetical protein
MTCSEPSGRVRSSTEQSGICKRYKEQGHVVEVQSKGVGGVQ